MTNGKENRVSVSDSQRYSYEVELPDGCKVAILSESFPTLPPVSRRPRPPYHPYPSYQIYGISNNERDTFVEPSLLGKYS